MKILSVNMLGQRKKLIQSIIDLFLDFLLPIFTRLSDRSLLLRCLPGYSQNQNESLNGIVWSKAPKHKYKGPKALEMEGISAVLQFDSGSKAREEVMKLASIPCSNFTQEAGSSKDKKRISCAKKNCFARKKEKNCTKAAKTCPRNGSTGKRRWSII